MRPRVLRSMTPVQPGDGVASAVAVRKVGLSMIPLAAIGVAMFAAILFGVTAPPSSPPSERTMSGAILEFVILSIGCLICAAIWVPMARRWWRLTMSLCIAVVLPAAGWRVGRLLDTAWTEACEFGPGARDRCDAGADGASAWMRIAWTLMGLASATMCAAIALVARQGDARREPTITDDE